MTSMETWHKMHSQQEEVILVDTQNQPIGTAGKIEAHQGKGMLHRAITVILLNSKNEILLTKRSSQKPLWPLWWDAACSTHQWPGENEIETATRRLPFEIGLTIQDLHFSHHYEYHAVYNDQWSENEINHIVIGHTDQNPILNLDEAVEFSWKTIDVIQHNLQSASEHQYVPWLQQALQPFLV